MPPLTYPELVVADGAVAYWRLGETSGTTIKSAVAGAPDGTLSGSVTLGVPGALNDGTTAIAFASTGHASLANGSFSAFGVGSFSFEFWVRTSSAAEQWIFDNHSPGVTTGIAANLSPTVLILYFSVGAVPHSAQAPRALIADGAWHHVVGVMRRGPSDVLECWVDGVLRGSFTKPQPGDSMTSTAPSFVIGRHSSLAPNGWNGDIDEFAIYKTALTPAQIAAHYNARTPPDRYPEHVLTDGAVGYWRLDETSGTTVASRVGGWTGTPAGSVTFDQPGALADGNPAMAFAGGHVALPARALPGVAITVEAWIKTSTRRPGGQIVFATRNEAVRGALAVGIDGNGKGLLWVDFETTVGNFPTGPLDDGQWHYVVWRLTGTQASIFVDGVETGPFAQPHTAVSQALPARIGASPAGFESFLGILDEVAIYQTALSPAQIAAHYAARVGPVMVNARLGAGRLNAFRLNAATPATIPANPTPAAGALAGPLALRWTGPGVGVVTDVYLGTSATPPLIAPGVSTGTASSATHAYALPSPTILQQGVVYYWRVVHRNALGTVTGPVWTFTATAPSTAPVLVSPADGATNVPLLPTFTWTGPTNVADVVYDFFLDGSMPYARGIPGTSYAPPAGLAPGAHRWKVVARNAFAGPSSVVWTFTTIADATGLVIAIGGVVPAVRIAGLSIRDQLNNQPNTCRFRVDTTAPTVGQEVQLGLGALDASALIFAGRIDTVTTLYESVPANRAWDVTCQDYTPGLNSRKVRRRYAQQAAHLIALDLLTRYAPSGYTGAGIVDPLPTVEGGIDFTEEDLTECFTRLAARIGGYWYVDYVRAVHLFLTEASDAPTTITRDARVLLNEPGVTHAVDTSQLRTRVFVEGGGSEARLSVVPGATVLPVTDASWYSASGGLVVSGPQRIRYTGKGTSGGPAAPSVATSATVGNLSAGPYSYRYAHVVSGSEGTPSGVSAVLYPGAVAPPAVAMGASPIMAAGFIPNPTGDVQIVTTLWGDGNIAFPGTYAYGFASVNAAGRRTGLGPLQQISTGSAGNVGLVLRVPSGAAGTVSRYVYRTPNGGDVGQMRMVNAIDGNGDGYTFTDRMSDAELASQIPAPTWNATADEATWPAGTRQVVCTFVTAAGETSAGPAVSIAVGDGVKGLALTNVPTSTDARVTARRIYRNAAGSSTLKLAATLADNSATTVSLTLGDGALGATVPATNSTGSGSVAVGNITTGPAGTTARRLYRTLSGGAVYRLVVVLNDNTTTDYLDTKADGSLGEAAVDDVLVELTGIPASGEGAVLYDVLKGDEVNLIVQVDDVPAQQALAAALGPPSDGIIEHYIQDRRLGQAQAVATGRADLALFARPIETVEYATRDPKTRSGKTVTINLPEMGINGLFTIQTVELTEIGVAPGLYPRYRVTASTVQFSFEDVLRRVQLETPGSA